MRAVICDKCQASMHLSGLSTQEWAWALLEDGWRDYLETNGRTTTLCDACVRRRDENTRD